MKQVLTTLLRQRTARNVILALLLLLTMSTGMGPWYAAFMIRSHGMSTSELGLWMGLIFGLGGMAGISLGSYVATRWLAANESMQMRLIGIAVAALVPCYMLFLLLPQKFQALAMLLPLWLIFNAFLGPTFALLQRLVVDEMRATALAVVMLLANLIGMGVGPQVVGMLSDALAPSLGSDSLRYAMLCMSLVAFWSAYHFWVAGRTVHHDLLTLAGSRQDGIA